MDAPLTIRTKPATAATEASQDRKHSLTRSDLLSEVRKGASDEEKATKLIDWVENKKGLLKDGDDLLIDVASDLCYPHIRAYGDLVKRSLQGDSTMNVPRLPPRKLANITIDLGQGADGCGASIMGKLEGQLLESLGLDLSSTNITALLPARGGTLGPQYCVFNLGSLWASDASEGTGRFTIKQALSKAKVPELDKSFHMRDT